jgi:hypothetical protein
MIKIEDYMKKSLEERKAHLKLDEPCLLRGGQRTTVSIMMRGVLAFIFDTTLPVGQTVHACHACNNYLCSNSNHVYWGTCRENELDARRNGKKTLWEYTILKYGPEKAKDVVRRGGATHLMNKGS